MLNTLWSNPGLSTAPAWARNQRGQLGIPASASIPCRHSAVNRLASDRGKPIVTARCPNFHSIKGKNPHRESTMSTNEKVHSLLTPENCVFTLIDHQPQMLFGVTNMDRQTIINNTVGLAKAAKVFGVPIVLS